MPKNPLDNDAASAAGGCFIVSLVCVSALVVVVAVFAILVRLFCYLAFG